MATKKPRMEMDSLQCTIDLVGGRPYRCMVVRSSTATRASPREQMDPVEHDEDDDFRHPSPPQPARQAQQPKAQQASSPAATPAAVTAREPLLAQKLPRTSPAMQSANEPLDSRLLSLIKQEGEEFTAQFSCDPALFPHLIGRQGTTKQRLEQDTGTVLTFPRRDGNGAQGADVSIKGPSQQAVGLALRRLQLAVSSVLQGRGPNVPDYNYFVSLPLIHAPVQQGVQQFHQEAKQALQGAGLDDKMLNRPETLHLTVAMLKLYSDEARAAAASVLQGLTTHINDGVLGGTPLQVHLKGVDIMNDNPAAASVLYAKVVDADGRITQVVEVVRQALLEAGLFVPTPQDNGPIKLHATLINTGHAMAAAKTNGGRQTLDLRSVLALDLDLGSHVIPAVHLSQRFKFDPDSGYYMCAAALQLPA